MGAVKNLMCHCLPINRPRGSIKTGQILGIFNQSF